MLYSVRIQYVLFIHSWDSSLWTRNNKCRFFAGVNTFWVVQTNKPVIDAMNELNKRRKATSVSTFDICTLIDFCFDVGESKCITVNNYRAAWVKNTKDNVIYLNKQQTKDAVAYLLFNWCFTAGS